MSHFTRYAAIASLSLLLVAVMFGMSQSRRREAEVMRATRFELVNDSGKVVAAIGANLDGSLAIEFGEGDKKIEGTVQMKSQGKLVFQPNKAGKLEIVFGSDHTSIELSSPGNVTSESSVRLFAGKSLSGISAVDSGGTAVFAGAAGSWGSSLVLADKKDQPGLTLSVTKDKVTTKGLVAPDPEKEKQR